ncbi:TPA: hypothetical protein ACPZMC_003600 [Yersinia enterocolitica]|uniref:hypothetical protein n=1 Tax=Yersinia enterocolitica TaxID=630 RepID=UPI0005E6F8A5|nr:hypothetical protein [Yersinia enterocolitica]ELI8407393.1 hypothetical protein [Yersinia enterocolitica]CQR14149.1 Uncharacterised protein [Yersinia enterocolitica]CRX55724.1 Uncharacterised protein [Yersinia enterocolitica]HEC4988981.1 hypothetical protein [Yersinia enterocolitica]HEN3495668.1 hypothetical protein [Yersinia enterocolitica]
MNNLEELFIANAELAAELLQHMADNEIDSDYFAVVTDSPNCGREVQSEHSVTEVALMAAGIIEQLIAQLEAAQKERDDLLNQEFQQRLANAEHQLYMKDLAIHNIKASRKAQFRKRLAAEAALSAANERASREYPETLPCPVRLEPGLILGKGLPIAMLFRALSRRSDYEAEIDAMTPEQRAEHDQRMREGKKFISECIAPRTTGFTVEGE